MTEADDGEDHTEYEGWCLPSSEIDDGHPNDEADQEESEDREPPPTTRKPTLRDRIRDRLGVTSHQWYVIEATLIALPYPFFVATYVFFPVNETLFLGVTLAYSLAAMYVGFIA